MAAQLTVWISADLVEYVDDLVRHGGGSRADVVTRALTLYRRKLLAEQDVRILAESGDYAEFDGLTARASAFRLG